jgi:hypothetical protein
MMENLEIYNKVKAVPQEAKKPIGGGKLKGFTDINPMWRIKILTETFGPCGIGWWYKITDKHMEGQGNEVRAFVDIELYYKWKGEVSMPVVGTGGSSFLTMEQKGSYTSDECYKMALTDAISVAAKALGVAADVYYEKDRDKYTYNEAPRQEDQAEKVANFDSSNACSGCGAKISDKVYDWSMKKYKKPLCMDCQKKASSKVDMNAL